MSIGKFYRAWARSKYLPGRYVYVAADSLEEATQKLRKYFEEEDILSLERFGEFIL